MIVDEYLDYLYESSMKKKVAAAAVTTALATIGVSFQAYKKFMDGAEKACEKSPDKELCVKTFRQTAYKKRVASLNASLSKCSDTTEPNRCKRYIKKTIASLRRRIR